VVTPLIVTIQGSDQSKAALQSALQGLAGVEKGSFKLFRSFTDLKFAAQAVIGAIRGIDAALTGVLRAAAEQVNAEVRLAAALSKTGGNLKQQVADFKAFAESRQRITTWSDDATLALAAVGAQFGLTGDLLKRTIMAAQDQATQLGREPTAIIQRLGRVFQGSSDQVDLFGAVIDKSLPRVEAYSRVLDQLGIGLSEAIGAMPTSDIEKQANAWGEVKENLGLILLQTETYKRLIGGEGLAQKVSDFLGDPANMKKIAAIFDEVVASILKGVGMVLVGFERMIDGIGRIITIFDAPLRDAIAKTTTELEGVNKQWEEALDKLGPLDPATKRFAFAAGLLVERLRDMRGEVSLGGHDLLQMAAAIRQGTGDTKLLADAWQNVLDKLSQREVAAPKGLFADMARLFQEIGLPTEATIPFQLAISPETLVQQAAILREQALAMGADYVSAFQGAAVAAFDREIGLQEAFSRLGQDVRNIFVTQMSGAAFDPIKESLGQLAKVVAIPFQVVGQAINKAIIKPVVDAATEGLTALLSGLVKVFATEKALTAVSTAAAIAAIAAVTAAATPLGALWGGAAVAASIASFGAATASGAPPALAAILAGKLLAGAPLAEGGLVLPQPGGRQFTLGEGGEPELVLPLSEAPEFVREVMGGASVRIEVHIGSIQVSSEQNRERVLDELGYQFESRVRAMLSSSVGRRGSGGLL
jgi:hypothetical protein